MGTDTPNADRLRYREPPPNLAWEPEVLMLRDEPEAGGGFHNPYDFT